MDFSDILKIVVIGGAIFLNFYFDAKKKRKQIPQPKPRKAPATDLDEIRLMLEAAMTNKGQQPEPQYTTLEQNPAQPWIEEAAPLGVIEEQPQKMYESYLGTVFDVEQTTTDADQDEPLELSPIRKASPLTQAAAPRIDLRKAVIYQTILERKYS